MASLHAHCQTPHPPLILLLCEVTKTYIGFLCVVATKCCSLLKRDQQARKIISFEAEITRTELDSPSYWTFDYSSIRVENQFSFKNTIVCVCVLTFLEIHAYVLCWQWCKHCIWLHHFTRLHWVMNKV